MVFTEMLMLMTATARLTTKLPTTNCGEPLTSRRLLATLYWQCIQNVNLNHLRTDILHPYTLHIRFTVYYRLPLLIHVTSCGWGLLALASSINFPVLLAFQLCFAFTLSLTSLHSRSFPFRKLLRRLEKLLLYITREQLITCQDCYPIFN